MKKILSSLALIGCLAYSTPVLAQPKIGTVNLKKVFEEFWKTKQANASFEGQKKDIEKQGQKMIQSYQGLNEEYRKLKESANDQAISKTEQDRLNEKATAKLTQIKALERDIQEYRQSQSTSLLETKNRLRTNILRQIREVISAKAKIGEFTLVFDSAAEGSNSTPILLYTDGFNDLTDDVLSELNRGAPPGALGK